MRTLVTGGTGTLGKVLVRMLLERGDEVTVFSRDELKQWEMRQNLPGARYELGDVRDFGRVREVMRGMGLVIHAAALKHAPTLDGCPGEAWRTNVMGTENVVRAAYERDSRVLTISTDKACEPLTAYGASKLLAERLTCQAGHSAVRLGNLAGSRGSVVMLWKAQAAKGLPLTLTDARMTRHWLGVDKAAAYILGLLSVARGGEVFAPRCRSFRLIDLWHLLAPTDTEPPPPAGIRPGEKLHERMLSEDELRESVESWGGWAMVRGAPPAGECNYVDTSSAVAPMSKDDLAAALEAM